MAKQRVLRALLPFGFALIALGCADDGDLIFTNNTVISAYPGGGSSDHVPDKSADGRAFSAPGLAIDDFRFCPDRGSPGNGLVLFTGLDANGPFEGQPVHLFASYFDGADFTPPVEIGGENQDDLEPVDLDGITTCFLHDGGRREGDALVLFRRRESGTAIDENGNGNPENDANDRLYSFYFDMSLSDRAEATAPDGTTLQWGFSSLATFVDDDPGGDMDIADGDVSTFGFVSDGLMYTSEYSAEGESLGVSGQPTTFLYCVWLQEGEGGSEARLYYNQFDLGSDTTRFDPAGATDLLADAGVGGSVPATTTFEDADVDERVLVHNGLLLWRVEPADSGEDELLLGNVFTSTDVFACELLSRSDPDVEALVVPLLPAPEEVYGDDHALPRYWVVFEESGFSDGNSSTANDVMVACLELDGTAPQTEEIDEFTSGPESSVRRSSVSSAITRPGTHLFITWIQDHLPSEGTGPEQPTASLFGRGLDPFAVGPVANAFTGDVAQNNTALRLNADVLDGPGEIRRDVFDAQPQGFVGNGTSAPDRALQSDPLRLHWVFVQEEFDDPGSANASSDRIGLHVALVEWDDQATAPAFTTSSGASSDMLIDTVDLGWSFQNPALLRLSHVQAVDAGNGDVAVYYLNQGNHPDDASAVGDPGSSGSPTEVPALLLEIDISASGGPSFQAGEIIALSRMGNFGVVGNEPGCAFDHVHALGPFQGTRGIDIDGIGPYLEPVDRHPVCGYGPLTTLTIPPPPGSVGDPFAAFPESRLFFWLDGTSTEISSDGSAFGAPDYFQVDRFEVVPTPFETDVIRHPGWGPRDHNVFIRETNSGPGSPRVLTHRLVEPDSAGTTVFSPVLGLRGERVDFGAPVDVAEFGALPDGTSVDLYFLAEGHLYYNAWNGSTWTDATVVDDDSLVRVQEARPFGTFTSSGEPTTMPTVVIWTKDLGLDGKPRMNLRVRR